MFFPSSTTLVTNSRNSRRLVAQDFPGMNPAGWGSLAVLQVFSRQFPYVGCTLGMVVSSLILIPLLWSYRYILSLFHTFSLCWLCPGDGCQQPHPYPFIFVLLVYLISFQDSFPMLAAPWGWLSAASSLSLYYCLTGISYLFSRQFPYVGCALGMVVSRLILIPLLLSYQYILSLFKTVSLSWLCPGNDGQQPHPYPFIIVLGSVADRDDF